MGPRIKSSDLSVIPRMLLLWIVSTLTILVAINSSGVTSLPNIRIQVNSENLQSPPYLLDALKQVAKSDQRAAVAANQNNEREFNTGVHSHPSGSGSSNEAVASPSSSLDQDTSLAASSAVKPSSGARTPTNGGAESLEEMLDLDPETILRLSPESIVGSSMSAIDTFQASPAGHELTFSSEERKQSNNRLFQLDVTSSHLKRPSAPSSDLIEEEHSSESSQRPTITGQQTPNYQEPILGTGGAKSHVSPSVASEEASLDQASNNSPKMATELKEKIAASPPDTWEPSQVMQGVTNASLVPATVKRQYGHQTRTRITLGGGYQREQNTAQVNPSPSELVENKPEKPKAPPVRPPQDHHHQTPSSSLDNSRVIEIPERIVLPLSVFTKDQPSTTRENVTVGPTREATRKRDKRCPSNGVTSLEHPTACDKYFLCEDGYSSEQVCPNGLMYGTRDIVRDFCVHRWQAVCGDKSIPNPISSPGCRWQNGIFNVQGSPKCTPDFYECTDGLFEVKKCTISGQVYDDKTKSCQYAEQVDCTQEALADFQCPTDDQSNTYWPFPRYFLNERALIHCVSDKPQIIRCRDHERVDPEHLFCVPIDKNAPPVNEDGSPAEAAVSARRATTTQREKGKKVQKANT